MYGHSFLDISQLLHHAFIDLQTARRIQQDHVLAVGSRVAHGFLRYVRGLVPVSHGEDLYAHLFTVDLQLFDRGRSVNVQGHQQGLSASGFHLAGDLGSCCCFTGTLQAGHHDDGGLSAGQKGDLRGLGAHQPGQLLIDDLDDHLGRIQSVHDVLTDSPFLNGFGELTDHLEIDVRFQQGHLDLTQSCLDVRFCQTPFAAQVPEYVIQLIC